MDASAVLIVVLAVSACSWSAEVGSGDLHESILYYEPLSHTNTRVSRDAAGDKLTLHLTAFNRTFVAQLKPSRDLFHRNTQFKHLGESVEPLTFYKGHLDGDSQSSIHGHVIDGVFDGIIVSEGVEYHIEGAHKFLHSPSFHSLMYRSQDVHTPSDTCGAKGKLLEEMEHIQASARPVKMELGRYGSDRVRRASTNSGGRFCQMYIAADHLFLESIGGGNVQVAMSEMITIMTQVQDIFRATDFDNSGQDDGIIPLLARVEVLSLSTPGYRFASTSLTVNDFLDLWSQVNHEEFCLSLLFTYRDFANGVLGLAWVAQPPGGNRGGICEQRVLLGVGPRYLNTAIVSMLNFGRRQPRSVTVVTTAHEIGHNFGSPHDPGTGECSPGLSNGGNFLMFPQATDGAQTNNNRFSPCSRRSILAVLQSSRSDCFSATGSFCGNGLMEDGEECDCGMECDTDPCCNTDCTLTEGSLCSPSQPCCNESCMFRGSDVQCREETECGTSVNCTGTEATCGAPMRRDGSSALCNGGRNFCIDGVCAGSTCVMNSLPDCQCTEVETQRCDLCCVYNGTCTSTFNIDIPSIPGEMLESGRSCNNLTGYCDSNQDCRVVDNERTLNDLLDLFTIETLNTIVAWLSTYWYIPVGVVIGLAVLIILLQVTYRRRKPIKRRFSQARRSIRGGRGGGVSDAQSGGVAQPDNRRRPQRNISAREAQARLGHFFPTADRAVVESVIQSAKSESKAVKKMLNLGYPMKRVPIPRA